MARLLTLDRLAGHTQQTRCLSLSSSPLFPHTHTPHIQTHTPALRTRISRWLHSSQIRSIFHPSKKPPLSLLIVHWRPHIATVIVVSQQSITRQCETATPLQRKHDAALHCHFPPQTPPSLPPDIRPQTPSSCLTSICSSFPSSSHHLSPRRDSVS